MKYNHLMAVTAFLLIIVGRSAHADDAAATAPPTGLEEIVVTAQRREENLQRAALAVSAVAGEKLTQASVTQATDLTRLLPSVQIAPAASFTQIYLRGVGSFGANAFAEQGVAFNLDGVYLSRPAAPAGLFYDLERIEVLKGPQGTLYGRNASGGALNVITAKPKLGDTSGFVTAEYGNYSTVKGSAAVNLPVGDKIAFRFSGQYAKHDGYFSDGYDDEDTKAGRIQVRADTGTGLDATVSVDYAKVGGMGLGGTIMPLLDGKTRLGPSDPAVIAAYLARQPTAPVPQIIAKNDGYQDDRFFGVGSTINLDLGFAKLTLVPAYRKTNLDFVNYSSSFLIDVVEDSHQSSVEMRLANQTGPFNWVAGGYYFDETVDANQFFDQASNGTKIVSALSTKSDAAFGQLTYAITDAFRVTGGLRYTKDHKTQDTLLDTLPFVGFVPGVFPLQPIILDLASHPTTNTEFTKTTWKAGIEYDVAPHSLLYASAATGFKSGILYAAGGQNYSRPETLTAYTLGSKNRFLDNTLQLNLELFYWDYKDQQVSHLGPVQIADTPAGPLYGPVFLTENAGAAKIRGVETEFLYQLTANDELSADIQYLKAKYDVFKYQFYSVQGFPPVVGCPSSETSLAGASPAARIYAIDCSGRPVVNAPEYTLNLGYEHTFHLSDSSKIMAGMDSRIESSRYLSVDFLGDGRQGSYTMSNAHLAYVDSSSRLSVTGYVNNLENALVFSNSLQSPVKTGTVYNQLRPPRTYGLRVGYRF